MASEGSARKPISAPIRRASVAIQSGCASIAVITGGAALSVRGPEPGERSAARRKARAPA